MKVRGRLELLLVLAYTSLGGEIDGVVDKLVEKNVLTHAETQILKTQTKEEIRALNAQGKNELLPQWIQDLMFKGDVRLRLQRDRKLNTGIPDRDRARLRLRLGAETRMSNNLKAAFGLATTGLKSASSTVEPETNTVPGTNVNDSEPRSTNYTFGDSLSKAPIAVDYAYIDYNPSELLRIVGGKFKNPIWNASDLLWDTDLNPDGIALCLNYFFSKYVSLFFTHETMIIDEIGDSKQDPYMYAFQPGLDISFSDIKIKSAVAYYIFSNVKGKKLDHSAGTNRGAKTALESDYTAVNPSISIVKQDIPLINSFSVFGDYVINIDSADNEKGFCVGAQIGYSKVGDARQWLLKGMYRELETDAWLDIFPDSDAYGGKTNSKGYEFIFEYGLTKNASIAVDYYGMDKLTGSKSKYPDGTKTELVQLDFIYRF